MIQARLNNTQSSLQMLKAFSTTATGDHLNNFGANKKKEPSPFSTDSNMFLLTKYMVYQLCRFPLFVQNAQQLTNGLSKVFGKPPLETLNRQKDGLLLH
jgi:hypothetical protein